jgi:gamma-glutamyltranspeptidase / glutathione hydrolase
MRGAVAGGSRQAVDAGVWALREGGTAVDAVVAAVLAAFVAEGPLTGPAGGGFLLVDRPGEDSILLDCFFAVPAGSAQPMDEVVIDFGDASTQVFHVGEGSVAVPGLVHGLAEAHARLGRLRWESLFTPALELAQRGFAVTPAQAFLHGILEAILLRDAGGRRIYGTPGMVVTGDLVPTLRLLRDAGAEGVSELLPSLGDELAGYRVVERQPLTTAFAAATVLTTPAPSVGGAVVARGLEALAGEPSTAAGIGSDAAVALARALSVGYAGPSPGAKPTGTTHVSVIDGSGAVAALSSTLGSGAGVFRHGFQLNNMLGELDVIGEDVHEPGARLPSMMTPTLALVDGVPRLALGSAGSVRLSGAILQVLVRVIAGGIHVEEAIARPRLHVDGETVHVEGGWDARVADALVEEGWDVVRWADRNLFFGGTSGVEARPDGAAGAAGDPRRDGFGAVVR